jgi:cbb3-type cytochrome oxidase cytochrome c subunit
LSKNPTKDKIEELAKKDIVAIIAYLQRLGIDIKAVEEEPAAEVAE